MRKRPIRIRNARHLQACNARADLKPRRFTPSPPEDSPIQDGSLRVV